MGGRKQQKAAPAVERRLSSAWEKRLRSQAFQRELIGLIADELRTLADRRLDQVIDAGAVRQAIEQGAESLVRREAVGELAVEAGAAIVGRLYERNESVLQMLDSELGRRVDEILEEEMVFSRPVQDFVERLIRQEFVQALFTDIIYTSILSFHQRVNPLFGRLAMGMMEEQIKGFIRVFMPMVQQEAIRFATSRHNQAVFFDFARSVMRMTLSEPLPRVFALVSDAQRRRLQSLAKQAISSERIDAMGRDLLQSAWDAAYPRIRRKRLGELLRIEEEAEALAERIVATALPLLGRPRVFQLLAREAQRMAGID